ncbi:protein fluG [Phalaenopsis equestris]|uniref:protein fluG n=1 Tax=Phalaenopsis equestris TaxID=78828 RepID=UPI0009E3C289|nr:protein fluG [Phalaenopsis equestris]
MAEYSELRKAVDSVAVVDAHAHNLVAIDSDFSFLRCFSEADGEALTFVPHTLSFKRNVRDIARLYNCEASFDAVDAHRKSCGITSVTSRCIEAANISTIFIDDGIKFVKMYDWEWHSRFGPAVGRILRIEHLAETILNDERYGESNWTLELFSHIFLGRLESVVDKIVAMKSIAAYRSGLQIDTNVSKIVAEEGLLQDLQGGKPVRIKSKGFIDYIFTCSLEVAQSFNLPVQIHTGFGDTDLDLRQCNPLHLRAVLEEKRFSKCRIVLLHAAYPYSKEASYLASVYPQVYLDFGLAVPMLSVQGMISSVTELLHLAPIKKVMYSSDGFAFPELYYLGSKSAREVLFHVLSNACKDGDLTVDEAVLAVQDIFRENALWLYNLRAVVGSTDYNGSIIQKNTLKSNALLDDIVFVRIIWVDASGQQRCRAVPARRFYEVVANTGVGLTFASMAMTSFADGVADGTNLSGTGEVRLVPDCSTKHRIPWSNKEEMVLADMQIKPGESWEYCPRSALQRVAKILKEEFDLVMNAGFENEFYLLKIIMREGNEHFLPFDLTSYCSASGFDAVSPILQEINAALQALDISVEQLHAEAGNGQFEISLGHSSCTSAADNLVFTRETIRSTARKHGLRATFLPKYFLDDFGSGSHVHLSLWKDGRNVFMGSEDSKTPHGISEIGEKFMAGVFHHLPSIFAFTAPLPNSYDRLQPNTWSGAYHCWGKENREAPIRTASPPGISQEVVSNFEIKSFDGCANPHLAIASIIAAGIDGLRRNHSLPDPIDENPSSRASELRRLPNGLHESIQALAEDNVLKDLLGEKLTTAVIAIRKAEIDYYGKNKEAYKQLIHKY